MLWQPFTLHIPLDPLPFRFTRKIPLPGLFHPPRRFHLISKAQCCKRLQRLNYLQNPQAHNLFLILPGPRRYLLVVLQVQPLGPEEAHFLKALNPVFNPLTSLL